MQIAKSKIENYFLTVGLEIHAELKTRTKMFCDSKNDTNEPRPNTNICPICLGYPGTLPVINKEALRSVLRLGLALGGELADYTEFERKNYFYPDIPKGYQISQYKYPLVRGGVLAGVNISRIHLEEDTAKSQHNKSGDSLLDFNRAGVPLVEMVTEPVIHTALEAVYFAKEFQLLLQYLGISGANMEKGEMRIEANVSVGNRPLTTSDLPLGTKVEVKNLNSFRSVEKAIGYEFERQVRLLEGGEEVTQETRGWDEEREETFAQRSKEESHDYRYFPDPDLPKLFIKEIPDFAPEALRRAMPELPWEKRARLLKLGISREHAEIYVTQPERGKYFEEVIEILKDPALFVLASNYIASELKGSVALLQFSEVIKMVAKGELSSKGAKEVIKILTERGGEARAITAENNLLQISDREVLKKIVAEVSEANPGAPMDFLVGQAIKKSGGRANPVILRKILKERKETNGGNGGKGRGREDGLGRDKKRVKGERGTMGERGSEEMEQSKGRRGNKK